MKFETKLRIINKGNVLANVRVRIYAQDFGIELFDLLLVKGQKGYNFLSPPSKRDDTTGKYGKYYHFSEGLCDLLTQEIVSKYEKINQPQNTIDDFSFNDVPPIKHIKEQGDLDEVFEELVKADKEIKNETK